MTPVGRAAWRLAWREARSAPWRHTLIVAMIALAVAAAVVVAGVVRSDALAGGAADEVWSGGAQVSVERWQNGPSYDDLDAAERAEVDRLLGGPLPTTTVAEVEDVLAEVVPDGAALAVERQGLLRVAVEPEDSLGGEAGATTSRTVALEAGDGLHDGRFPGWAARSLRDDEVVLDRRTAGEVDAEVGSTVTTPLGELTVVGITSGPLGSVVAADRDLPNVTTHRWSIGDVAPGELDTLTEQLRDRLEPDVDRVFGPGEEGVEATVQVNEHPDPSVAPMTVAADGPRPELVGAIVATALLSLVGFVSAAVFATGVRRRVRTFGLLATAAGADARHLRAIVRREALVLGGLGALVGAGLGTFVALVVVPAVQDRFGAGSSTAAALALGDVLTPAVLALVVALIAAWSPARTVARTPPATALAGRVPQRPVRPWVAPSSLVLVALGTVATAALLRAPTRSSGFLAAAPSAWWQGAEFRAIALTGAVGLLLVGIAGLAGPLVALLGRAAPRLPLTWRLALRDSARQRTRSAATVAATSVVLALPVLLGAIDTTPETLGPARPDLERRLVGVGGVHYGPVTLSPSEEVLAAVRDLAGPVVAEREVAVLGDPARPARASQLVVRSVVDDTLDRGGSAYEAVLLDEALRDLLGVGPAVAAVLADPFAAVNAGIDASGPVRIQDADPGGASPGSDRAAAQAVVPLELVGSGPPAVASQLSLDAATAQQLGLSPTTRRVVLELEAPVTDAQIAAADDLALDTGSLIGIDRPSRSDPPWQLVATLAAGVVALVLALMAAGLAATESDRMLARLRAAGAPPRLRPRFRAAQAGAHALLAGVLAIPAGLLLAAAARGPATGQPGPVVPWMVIVLLLLVVPVLVGTPLLASRPGRSDTSRRAT